MTVSIVLDTLLIALGAWLIGGTVGGALGILIARRNRILFTAAPHLRRLSMLIPWRFIVLSLFIVTWTPAAVWFVGLRPTLGLINTGVDMFLLTSFFIASVLLDQWRPLPFAVRITAGLRTLATSSLAAAAFLSDFHGIGWYMSNSLSTFHFDEFFQEWLVLAGLILILDVLLGIVQLTVADHIEKGQHLHSVTQ